MKFLFFVIILAAVGYGLGHNSASFQKIKNFFGNGYQEVDVSSLFSISNIYSGKNVCAKGYYIESMGISVLKPTFDGDLYNKSVWIVNATGRKIFVDALGDGKGALSKLCGKFESGGGKGFGQPSLWNYQITVEDFQLLGPSTLLPR